MDKKQHLGAEDMVDNIDANRSKKRIWIATGVVAFTLDNVCGIFYNFISNGRVMYIFSISMSKPFVVMYINVVIHFTLERNTITWFNTKKMAARQ